MKLCLPTLLTIAALMCGNAVADLTANCDTQARYALLQTPVVFDSASAQLPSDAYGILQRLAEIAFECPTARIEVGGHTDSRGIEHTNTTLSRQRAEAVATALIAIGIDPNRLSAKGYGGTQPVADNDTRRGRARNRRITVVFSVVDRLQAD
ncbi:MAG: OmpA family protein [Pseudomonadota bacterium]